jgi:hypothetical protein
MIYVPVVPGWPSGANLSEPDSPVLFLALDSSLFLECSCPVYVPPEEGVTFLESSYLWELDLLRQIGRLLIAVIPKLEKP